MNKENKTTRCIRCDKSFSDDEIKNACSCPSCNSTSIPMSVKNDLTIKINLQELRILGIWAENHAFKVDNDNLDNPTHESLKELVNIIAKRISKQFPPELNNYPLTLTQEMEELKNSGLCSDVIMYIDGKEQV